MSSHATCVCFKANTGYTAQAGHDRLASVEQQLHAALDRLDLAR